VKGESRLGLSSESMTLVGGMMFPAILAPAASIILSAGNICNTSNTWTAKRRAGVFTRSDQKCGSIWSHSGGEKMIAGEMIIQRSTNLASHTNDQPPQHWARTGDAQAMHRAAKTTRGERTSGNDVSGTSSDIVHGGGEISVRAAGRSL
jgi:hypothetical protein